MQCHHPCYRIIYSRVYTKGYSYTDTYLPAQHVNEGGLSVGKCFMPTTTNINIRFLQYFEMAYARTTFRDEYARLVYVLNLLPGIKIILV